MPGHSISTIWVLPYRYEFWDREFVKSCPIMGTAERNYFPPYFLAKNGLKTKKTEHFDRFFRFSFGGPDGGARPRSVTFLSTNDELNCMSF